MYMKEKGLSLLLQLLDDMVGLLDPELMPTSSEAEVVCVCVCVCVCVVLWTPFPVVRCDHVCLF